jgi:hypothetical protein
MQWLLEMLVLARSVLLAIAPLVLVFLLFQVFLLKLPVRRVAQILTGTLVAAAGLFLFLSGVALAFLPFGRVVGEALGALDGTWLMVAIGVVLGFATAWGEPAVRVLADQVDEASNGSIPAGLVLNAICAGVAAWVGIGMLRIALGLDLLYLLVAGYGLIVVLMWLSSKDFVPVAADAGGVAAGPLANSFLLALALGASSASGADDPVVNGFGLVALVTLAPTISVMAVGVLVRWKTRRQSEAPTCATHD